MHVSWTTFGILLCFFLVVRFGGRGQVVYPGNLNLTFSFIVLKDKSLEVTARGYCQGLSVMTLSVMPEFWRQAAWVEHLHLCDLLTRSLGQNQQAW